MLDINAIQIPLYNRSNPMLWFTVCESTFALMISKAKTESVMTYNYLVSRLLPHIASLVRNILLKTDATDLYIQIENKKNYSGEST